MSALGNNFTARKLKAFIVDDWIGMNQRRSNHNELWTMFNSYLQTLLRILTMCLTLIDLTRTLACSLEHGGNMKGSCSGRSMFVPENVHWVKNSGNWWWYGCEFGQDMPRSLLDHIALDMVSNDVQVWRLGEVWLLPLQYFMPQPVTFWCTEWQIRSMLSNGLNGQTIESCRSCRSWWMVSTSDTLLNAASYSS